MERNAIKMQSMHIEQNNNNDNKMKYEAFLLIIDWFCKMVKFSRTKFFRKLAYWSSGKTLLTVKNWGKNANFNCFSTVYRH